jgi:hypothetical protein
MVQPPGLAGLPGLLGLAGLLGMAGLLGLSGHVGPLRLVSLILQPTLAPVSGRAAARVLRLARVRRADRARVRSVAA